MPLLTRTWAKRGLVRLLLLAWRPMLEKASRPTVCGPGLWLPYATRSCSRLTYTLSRASRVLARDQLRPPPAPHSHGSL